tara:strand:- start:414 stop:623 length:210 start_codon:yes stop_codon:yes gene_type:complete
MIGLKEYLNYLRDLSYSHSDERREFAEIKLLAHKFYMEGHRKTSPFLHPDTWQDDREGQLSTMEKRGQT